MLADDPLHVLQRLLRTAVRGEAEVDEHPCLVRQGIGGHAGLQVDDVQALAVGTAIDGDLARLVVRNARHDGGELVCGVGTQPGTGRVRAGAMRRHAQANRALAAGLDQGTGGLTQEREIALQPLGVVLLQVA